MWIREVEPGMSTVTLVLLQFIAVCDVWALRGMKISVPTAVRSGATVTLSCDYDLEQAALYSIRWYHGDEEFYRYVPKESPPNKVFPMTSFNVDVSASDSRRVRLREVQREQSGYYKCEVSADAPLFHTDIRAQHMAVVDVPMEGPTLNVEVRKIAVGGTLRANCTGPLTYHNVNLTWYVNGEPLRATSGRDFRASRGLRHYPQYAEGLVTGLLDLQLHVDPSLFRQSRLRLRCLATLFTLYRRTDELEILEDTPQVAMVMRPTLKPHFQIYDGYSVSAEKAGISRYCLLFVLLLLAT